MALNMGSVHRQSRRVSILLPVNVELSEVQMYSFDRVEAFVRELVQSGIGCVVSGKYTIRNRMFKLLGYNPIVISLLALTNQTEYWARLMNKHSGDRVLVQVDDIHLGEERLKRQIKLVC